METWIYPRSILKILIYGGLIIILIILLWFDWVEIFKAVNTNKIIQYGKYSKSVVSVGIFPNIHYTIPMLAFLWVGSYLLILILGFSGEFIYEFTGGKIDLRKKTLSLAITFSWYVVLVGTVLMIIAVITGGIWKYLGDK